jgi:hypothetical protein
MCAERHGNSTDEIEITPRMLEAAVAVFRERDAFDFFADSTLATIAAEVYEAMALHRSSE